MKNKFPIIIGSLVIFIILSFTPVYAQIFLNIIKPLPSLIIPGNTYEIIYRISSYYDYSKPVYFQFYINKTEKISENEFNISAHVDQDTLNCIQKNSGFWKCDLFCLDAHIQKNLSVNLSIHPASFPSQMNYTLEVLGLSGCFGSPDNTWEEYDEVVSYETCPPLVLGDECKNENVLIERRCVNESIVETEFDCNSLDGKYNGIFRDYTCFKGECVYKERGWGALPKICIYERNVKIGIETGTGINPFDYRTSLYAFTGEQIEYVVVVRDADGADEIGFLKADVDGSSVLANEIPLNITECDGLGETNPLTDKQFHVIVTINPWWYGEKTIDMKVLNTFAHETDSMYSETWFFNPAISINVETSDGNTIRFEQMNPFTRNAYSLNKIRVKNTAEGGVNMWMYIAGTNIYDSSGTGKCPDDNYIDIEKYMYYRAWSGTNWQGNGGWTKMSRYDQNLQCNPFILPDNRCYGGKPVPYYSSGMGGSQPFNNILTNQGAMEIEFMLHYPTPCRGLFDKGRIYIIGKAI
jgi:hypothetical protein